METLAKSLTHLHMHTFFFSANLLISDILDNSTNALPGYHFQNITDAQKVKNSKWASNHPL
jgi:hypothetical protein